MPKLLNDPRLIEGNLTSSCPACGGSDLKELGSLPEAFHFCDFYYRHPINRGLLVECGSCDLHFRNPCLSSTELEDLYRRQPATVWGTVTEGRSDMPLILPIINQLEKSEIRALDVGCYTGGLLRALRNQSPSGKNILCFGIEPSRLAAKQAAEHGIEVLGPTIESLSASDHFDIIILTDVFEHILDSRTFLRKICQHLNVGGSLLIVTGAYDSKPFNRHRNIYNYAATPEHVAFISRRHADWLALDLNLDIITYHIISHAPLSSKLKRVTKTVAYFIGRLIPTRWLCVDWVPVSRVAWLRGLGVQNLSSQPDHAFIVMRRPAADKMPL